MLFILLRLFRPTRDVCPFFLIQLFVQTSKNNANDCCKADCHGRHSYVVRECGCVPRACRVCGERLVSVMKVIHLQLPHTGIQIWRIDLANIAQTVDECQGCCSLCGRARKN